MHSPHQRRFVYHIASTIILCSFIVSAIFAHGVFAEVGSSADRGYGATSGSGSTKAGAGSSASGGASLGGTKSSGGNPADKASGINSSGSAGGNQGSSKSSSGGNNSASQRGQVGGPSGGSGSSGSGGNNSASQRGQIGGPSGGSSGSSNGGNNSASQRGETSAASQARAAMSSALSSVKSFFSDPVSKTASGLAAATRAAMNALGITPTPKSTYTSLDDAKRAAENKQVITAVKDTNSNSTTKSPNTSVEVPEQIRLQIESQKVTAPTPGEPLTAGQRRALEIAETEFGINTKNPAAEAVILLAAENRTPAELRTALSKAKATGGDLNNATEKLGLGISCTSSDCRAAESLRTLAGLGNPEVYQAELTRQMQEVDERRLAKNAADAAALGAGRDPDKEVSGSESTRGTTNSSETRVTEELSQKDTTKAYTDYAKTRTVAQNAQEAAAEYNKKLLTDNCKTCTNVQVTYSSVKQDFEVTYNEKTRLQSLPVIGKYFGGNQESTNKTVNFSNLPEEEKARLTGFTDPNGTVTPDLLAQYKENVDEKKQTWYDTVTPDKTNTDTAKTRSIEIKTDPVGTKPPLVNTVPAWMFSETVPATLEKPVVTTNLFSNVPLQDVKLTVAQAAKVVTVPANKVAAFAIYDTSKVVINPATYSFVKSGDYSYPDTKVFNEVKSDIKAILPTGTNIYANNYGIPVMSPAELMLVGKFDLTRGGKYSQEAEQAALEAALRREIPGSLLTKINNGETLTETDLIEITGIMTTLVNRSVAAQTSIESQVTKKAQVTSVSVDGRSGALGTQKSLLSVVQGLTNGTYAKDLGLTNIEPDALAYATHYYSPEGQKATTGKPTPATWDIDYSKPTYLTAGGHIFGNVVPESGIGYEYTFAGKSLDLNNAVSSDSIMLASTDRTAVSANTDDSTFKDDAGRTINVNENGTGVRINTDGTKTQLTSLEVSTAYFGDSYTKGTGKVPIPGTKPTANTNQAQVPEQIQLLRDKQAKVDAVKNGYADYANSRVAAEKAKEAVAKDIKTQLEFGCKDACSDVKVSYSSEKQDYVVTFNKRVSKDESETVVFNELPTADKVKLVGTSQEDFELRAKVVAGIEYDTYTAADTEETIPTVPDYGPYSAMFNTDKSKTPTLYDTVKYWTKEKFDSVIGANKTALTRAGIIIEAQKDAVRNADIDDTLKAQLAYAGKVTNTYFVASSGGNQMSLAEYKAANGKKEKIGETYYLDGKAVRVGSDRHDDGRSADGQIVDVETGRVLDFNIPADKKRISDFISAAVTAGVNGVGAAENYMGTKTVHLGGGTENTWGKKGEAAPKWVADAHTRGLNDRSGFDVASLSDDSISTASTNSTGNGTLSSMLTSLKEKVYPTAQPEATLPTVETPNNPSADENLGPVNPIRNAQLKITNTVKSVAKSVWEGIKGILGSNSTKSTPAQPASGDNDTKQSTSTKALSDGKRTIEDVVSISVNFGINVGCPDLQGVSGNGYIYTATLKNGTNANEVIERAGCGLGTPQVYATEIARDLEQHSNFAPIDINNLFDKMTFKFHSGNGT